MSFDVAAIRAQFPTLAQPQVYLDNAGGSQILGSVADSIRSYLTTTNVQLGATYAAGQGSTRAYNDGLKAAASFINAQEDEIVIGPSTTQLFHNLSLALIPFLQRHPSPEIVLSSVDHEANLSSWIYLANIIPNLNLKFWNPAGSRENPQLTADSLRPLLTSNTVLVAFTHTSNVLGSITPVRAISDLVHQNNPDALVVVDGVACAPHRRVDVRQLGVDVYAFSWYKVFGPHIAQLFCRRGAQDAALMSLGHYFKGTHTLDEKLGLAGASYELLQAVSAVVEYVNKVGWDSIVAQEARISQVLLKYLETKPDTYTVYGEPTADAEKRVAVVSFGVRGRRSQEVVEKVEARTDFGFRWGHFYSKRLVDGLLGLGDDGVVRVSMLHYNTEEEIQTLVEALDHEVFSR